MLSSVWFPRTALTGFLLPSYMQKEHVLKYRHKLPVTVLDKLLKRNSRPLHALCGACLNVLFEVLIAVGLLLYVGVAWTFLSTYHRESTS